MNEFLDRLERAYRWLLIAPVILPVVVWSGLIYPYLVPKTLLFYALSLAAVAAFGILAAYGRSFFWPRLSRWEARIPIALLALAYIASYAGVDFYRSFWSLFIRGDGLLMLTCAVASFYLILLSADRAFFALLTRATAVIGSFVAIYGIGEWLINGGRIGSLLGNAAFFAGYLGIALFATLIAAEQLTRARRAVARIGAGLQALAIILTATRGTLLALGLALIVFLVYISFRKPEPPEAKNGVRPGRAARSAPFFASGGAGWARIALIALIIIAGLFAAFRSTLARSSFSPIARIASIGVNDPDVASRLFIWRNMTGELAKSPWLGVGAEHVDVLFNHFYDPTQISEEWFDRSHNAFLDYAAQYGIGGLLLYLALIASFFTAALRLRKRGEHRVAGLAALLALVYAAQNFFVFDTISSFWLMLALLAAALALAGGEAPRTARALPAWTRLAAWPAACVLILLIIPVSVAPARAAYGLAHGYVYGLVDVPKEAEYFYRGYALGTYGDLEYGYTAYDAYSNKQLGRLSGDAFRQAYELTASLLRQNFERYPYDARTALYLAQVLSLAPPEAGAEGNLLANALERAIRLSPKRAQPWYILANLSIGEANKYPPKSPERAAGYAAARDILEKYVALVPTLSTPHFVLAELYFAIGDIALAKTEAARGDARYKADLQTAERAALLYERMQDWQNAAVYLQRVVDYDNSNYNSYYDLAKVKYMLGDHAGSLRIVEDLRAIHPDILGTDQNFLTAVTDYEQTQK